MDFNLREFIDKINANKDSLLWSIARECGYDFAKVMSSEEVNKLMNIKQEEKEKKEDKKNE